MQSLIENFDSYNQSLLDKLLKATKQANSIPINQLDYDFQLSDHTVKRHFDSVESKILSTIQSFLQRYKPHDTPVLHKTNSYSEDSDEEEQDEKFEIVVDLIDTLLEKVDTILDEVGGRNNRNMSATVVKTHFSPSSNKVGGLVQVVNNIARPQLKFEDPVDNSNKPWKPKIKHKPNAITPLSLEFNVVEDSWNHPYEYEINNFFYAPWQLEPSDPQAPKSLDQTPFHWVDTVNQLVDLESKLKNCREIAVDLENHSYRTFQGFVCLMQISTREEDFIIDTLALRSHLHLLNSVFTDPRIVKVLHGSDSDILWLQRDFGIYIVNLMDTGQAARVLEYPKFSLAYLLHKFCQVIADKQYQLADWRIRPVPEEMIKYAREDTHYLLYIYDCMRNELLSRGNNEKNILISVLNRSRELCLKKYDIERLTETTHLTLYNKYNLVFNPQQMRVFAALFRWRDQVARSEDENPRYVLPNHMLFKISEVMPTGTSQDKDSKGFDCTELFSCCAPVVPPMVRLYATDILIVINQAKKETASAPLPVLQAPPSTPTPTHPRVYRMAESPVLSADQLCDSAGWVTSPSTSTQLTRNSNLPALFSKSNQGNNPSTPINSSTLFCDSSSDEDEDTKETVNSIRASFVQIFQDRILQPTFSLPTQLDDQLQLQYQQSQQNKNIPTKEQTVQPAEIPKSMADIYQLANKVKRKRTEDKKRAKEPAENTTTDGTLEDLLADTKKQKTVDFVKEIGWVSDVSSPATKQALQEIESQEVVTPKKPTFASSKKSAPTNFNQFDYGSALAAEANSKQQTNQNKQFNPLEKITQNEKSIKKPKTFRSGNSSTGNRTRQYK